MNYYTVIVHAKTAGTNERLFSQCRIYQIKEHSAMRAEFIARNRAISEGLDCIVITSNTKSPPPGHEIIQYD